MFSFERRSIGRFNVFTSRQRAGDIHKKKFAPGATPQNQATTNVYVQGEFEFSIAGFKQTLSAGNTNLDLQIAEFPAGAIATERVLSPTGIRHCASVAGGGIFARDVIQVEPDAPVTFESEALVFALSGSVSSSGESLGAGEFTLVGAGDPVSGSGSILVMR